jgi:serine/threonine protein kinase/class 3 adenylate cyclase
MPLAPPRENPNLESSHEGAQIMTVVTADGAPTIRIGSNEPIVQAAEGLAILFAEVVGSGAMGDAAVVANGENVARGTTAQRLESIAEAVRNHQGQIVRTIGASMMAEFTDLSAAVHAAVTMQRMLMESNQTPSQSSSKENPPALRIGIDGLPSCGRNMEAFGHAAHAASSIAKHAAPGQILTSQRVCDALEGESGLHLQWFRNINASQAESEDVFEVHWAAPVANIPSRYEAMYQVGAGGMGIVYKARDRETGDIVALKVLRSEIASDPAMQENLKREVLLARKVTQKNVCRIHEFNRSNGMACISMEFVEGASLQSTLQRSGPLPWNQALPIALQICAGLGEAHAQGIVHRDLKPANIMVDRSGVAKIMDFGIARPFQGAAQLTGTLVGTPAYMAPEQVEMKGVDARTDVYALGLLLYEIVTGSQAFEGDTAIAVAVKQLREFPKRPREIVPTLPAHAEAVILTCLEKDPAHRYQTMDAVAAALKRNSPLKPAVAWHQVFTNNMRLYAHDLNSKMQPRVRQLAAFARQDNSRLFSNKRTQQALAWGVAAACLLALLVVFTAKGARKNYAVGSSSIGEDSKAMAAASNAAVAQPALGTSTKMTATGDVAGSVEGGDQSSTVPTSLADSSSSTWSHAVDLGAGSAERSEQATPHAATTRIIENKKTRPMIKSAAASVATAKATTSQSAAQMRPSQQPAATSPEPAANDQVSNGQNTESADSDLVASNLPATTAPAASALVPAAEKAGDASAVQAVHYFEVGSFKESAWADRAVEKLTQLGFHATSIRKNLLWVQSYQVRVGPYTDAKELEAARQNLMSQGFKPHAVK